MDIYAEIDQRRAERAARRQARREREERRGRIIARLLHVAQIAGFAIITYLTMLLWCL